MKINYINIYGRLVLTMLLLIGCCASYAANREKQFVVVIDAGHGGKDVGALGNDLREKDINLAIAQKVASYLKKKKGYKVVMTRDDDTFIGLKDRADKANKEKADLFISIHTNSLDEKNPQRTSIEGASVYVLGLHKDAENLAVSRRENAVIAIEGNTAEKYEGFDATKDESYIIFEMAQKKNLSRSIGLAKAIQNQLVKHAGRKDRGVHQAGFLVLRETAMPSVLIEVDFICNPNSAKFISSSAGQTKLARAIATAIEEYRNTIKKHGDKAYEEPEPKEDNVKGDFHVLRGQEASAPRQKVNQSKGGQSRVARQRRTASARKASSNRNIETETISVGSTKAAAPAAPAKNNGEKSSAKSEKTVKNEKKSEKPAAKSAKTNSGKSGKSGKSDKANKSGKTDKSVKSDKSGNADKTEKTGKSDKSGKADDKGKSLKAGKDNAKKSNNPYEGKGKEVKAVKPAQQTKKDAGNDASNSHKSLKSKKNKN